MSRQRYQKQAFASLKKCLQQDFGQAAREVLDGTWDKIHAKPDPDTHPFLGGGIGTPL